MKPLTANEGTAVSRNLFSESAGLAFARADFPWHRDNSGRVTATLRESSQALAIDVFGILPQLRRPSRIVDAWSAHCGFRLTGPWLSTLERPVPRSLLGEPRPTQIDALLESDTGLILVECKFTEANGGFCSQPKPISKKSPNRGMVQCSGDYIVQTNPVNHLAARCALTAKGVRYWETVPKVLSIPNDIDHRPCQFKGGWYQWMRNLVSCHAMCEASGKKGAFLVVYADGPFSMSRKIATSEWQDFVNLTVGGSVPLKAVSYQQLIEVAIASGDPSDRDLMKRLREWVYSKIGDVAASAT